MKKLIATILAWQTKRLLAKQQPVVIVIVGSVGKTSTTQAIATMLQGPRRVRATRHNYNSDFGVPCSVFNKDLPNSVFNPFAWASLLVGNELALLKKQTFDTVVLELGTDSPGDIASFAYLKPHIAVVTAVAPEHMQFFKTLDAVAEEELSVTMFSDEVVCNMHMVDRRFVKDKTVHWYDSHLMRKYKTKPATHGVQGEQAAAAAIWVAERVGIGTHATEAGLAKLKPQPGRMQILPGIAESVIIDDTYNSSPEAAHAALLYLMEQKAPARIALLGNMNELGDYSELAHHELGLACSPDKLDVVVTLGPDANAHLAHAAESKGCRVIKTATPQQSADVIREELKRMQKPGTLILCKGSQNRVFAEEAVKGLLAHKTDRSKLVRQSDAWLRKKAKSFNSISAAG